MARERDRVRLRMQGGCQRQSLAAQGESAPSAVVWLVKEFLSDAQPLRLPELVIRADARVVFQALAGPSSWDCREDIDAQAVQRVCRTAQEVCS